MDYGMDNVVERLGLEGTHVPLHRVNVLRMPDGFQVFTHGDPRDPANLFLDPFMGANPLHHHSGALTVVLPMVLEANDFAELASECLDGLRCMGFTRCLGVSSLHDDF